MSKHYQIAQFNQDIVPPRPARSAHFRRKSNVLSVAVCALVIPGLIATVALPAYGAVAPAAQSSSQRDRADKAQTLEVSPTSDSSIILSRESFSVIAPVAKRGPGLSLKALLANPPYPNFNLGAVVGVAQRYLGVPYQLGGESPAGFDCSGLVAYVYAQFGIALPHSAAAQGRIGTPIARAAALPGDVVVMDGGSHVGIYLGGNRMIDAPEPGRVVTERAIYDNNYYVVRFGI